MTTLLRPLFLRPQFLAAAPLGLGLGLSLYTLNSFSNYNRGYKCDTTTGGVLGGSNGEGAGAGYSYTRSAKTPVVTREGRLNAKAVRQVSFGSITGLCAGILVSTFSKSLAIILGLLVVGVQYASSYGIHIIPYNRLQKYVNGIDLRSAVQDNVALKVSFGLTFALAGFTSF